jgi:hypothetical protein
MDPVDRSTSAFLSVISKMFYAKRGGASDTNPFTSDVVALNDKLQKEVRSHRGFALNN